MFWPNVWPKASLLTDMVRGATGAPWPACPQPARIRAAATARAAEAYRDGRRTARRIRSWPDVTLALFRWPTVDSKTWNEAYGEMTRRMVRQNRRRSPGTATGRPERADAGHAAYRATWPASGARRDGACHPRRRPSAARPAHLARSGGRACRAVGLAGGPDMAGGTAGQPRQCPADPGLALASRTAPGPP